MNVGGGNKLQISREDSRIWDLAKTSVGLELNQYGRAAFDGPKTRFKGGAYATFLFNL